MSDLNGITMKKYHEFGPIVRDNLLSKRSIWLFDPDDIALVYRSESQQPIRGGLDAFELYRNIRRDVYGDEGLLTTSHSNWYRFRSIAQPYLMRKNHFKQYFNGINYIAEKITDKIGQLNFHNENYDILMLAYKWTLDSIGMVMFNFDFNCINCDKSEDNQLIELVSDMLEYGYKIDFQLFPIWRLLNRPFGLRWHRYIQANDKFIGICMKHIDQAIELYQSSNKKHNEMDLNESNKPYTNCLVSKLLSTGQFSKKDISSLILELVMAGIDSTAHHLIFCLFHLAKNQNYQNKLLEEINSVELMNNGLINFESIEKMKYVNAIIKETHRLSPVVIGTNRILKKDLIIKGYLVPKETLVALVTYVGSHIDKYFYKQNQFMPNRWLRSEHQHSIDNQNENQIGDEHDYKKINPFSLLPFGFGARTCIGKAFAQFEVKLLIIKLVKRYQIQYDGDQINMTTKFINYPLKPLKFKFTPRN